MLFWPRSSMFQHTLWLFVTVGHGKIHHAMKIGISQKIIYIHLYHSISISNVNHGKIHHAMKIGISQKIIYIHLYHSISIYNVSHGKIHHAKFLTVNHRFLYGPWLPWLFLLVKTPISCFLRWATATMGLIITCNWVIIR